jgi:uncharacterized protein (TIGR01319 family)
MTTAPTDSILAADIGSVTTRAALFDIVSGHFRFLGVGEARSTTEPPFSYMGEGLRQALDHLGVLTGRAINDTNDRIIMPARTNGTGVDSFAVSASAGKPLRTVIVGLMPNLSVASAEHIASSAHVLIVDKLGLGDPRRTEKQIDDLIHANPDLIILAGGTDNGSQGAVLQLADTVATAARRMRDGSRPVVLFIGNAVLHDRIREIFSTLCDVVVADNVRPALSEENLTSARRLLGRIYEHVRLGGMPGYGELAQWSSSGVTPNTTAIGNIVRHISESSNNHPILCADIGSATTTLVAAVGSELALTVRSDLGVGHSAGYLNSAAERMSRWLPEDFSDSEVRDYISNKTLHPESIPYELHDLYLEHALARQCLQAIVQTANWPTRVKSVAPGLLPHFDTIIGTGAVLAHAAKPGQAALILLDGLQPTGLVTLVLDWQTLVPLLGAAAGINPVAVVQSLEAGALVTLGSAVGVTGEGRLGQPAVRVSGMLANGHKLKEEITFGSIAVFHMPPGDSKVTIQALGGFDAGSGRGGSKTLTLGETAVGLIIDARGRPLALPGDPAKRRDTVKTWSATVGQYGL